MPEKKKYSAVAVAVRTILNLVQYGLMGWAAFVTTGILHWALVGYLAFCAVVVFAMASTKAMEKEGAA